MQINPQNVLNPYIQGPGLAVTVSSGTVLLAGQPTTVPTTIVVVSPNTTSYIYLPLATGLVTLNTTGFPSTNVYPIATVVSNASGIFTLIDSRPDIFIGVTNATGAVLLNPAGPQTITGFALTVEGLLLETVTETSNYTALATDNLIFADATSGPVTIQLPNTEGAFYRVKKIDASTNAVTVQMVSGNVDGQASTALNIQYQSVDVQGDGVNGWVFGGNNQVSPDITRSFSSNTTIGALAGNNLIGTCTGGAGGITVTLPSAAASAGLSVKLIKIDSGAGLVNISGAVSSPSPLANRYQYVVLESNGTNWYVIGNN